MSAMLLLSALLLAGPEASVHGRSKTTMIVGSQPMYSAEARAVELKRFAPVIEEVSIGAAPGVEGLRLHVDAWTAIDAADQFRADRAIADLTEAFVEWKNSVFDVRAGRMFLFTDTGRAHRIDGGAFKVAGAIDWLHAEAEAWAGAPVSTLYGAEPLRGSLPNAVEDPLFFTPRGSDWSRPGDVAFGVRTAIRVFELAELGVGFVEERDLAEVDREALIGRLSLQPIEALAVDAFASYDVYAAALEDAELSASMWIDESVRTGVYGRRRVPGLTLPSTSIFSVFASEEHSEVGAEADWFIGGLARISGSAELRYTAMEDGSESALGYRLTASARTRLSFWPGARTALSYERLLDGWFGRYDYLRWSAELPFSEHWSLAPDIGVFLVEKTGDELALAGRIGLSATVAPVENLTLVAGCRATEDADGGNEVAVIGRIEWNVDYTF